MCVRNACDRVRGTIDANYRVVGDERGFDCSLRDLTPLERTHWEIRVVWKQGLCACWDAGIGMGGGETRRGREGRGRGNYLYCMPQYHFRWYTLLIQHCLTLCVFLLFVHAIVCVRVSVCMVY